MRHPFRLLAESTAPLVAERKLDLPTQYRTWYDQGEEGACVGFSASWMMSILNRRKYDARKLYHETQKVDEWADTPPEEGTSVRAAMDVLRDVGHWRFFRGMQRIAGFKEGIAANRWATTVDECRACIANGTPFVCGVNWYENFDKPVTRPHPDKPGSFEYWIGLQSNSSFTPATNLGAIRGGHAIAAYRVSDRRQAFRWVNTWGTRFPDVWIPFAVLERLIRESGEVTLVTDR